MKEWWIYTTVLALPWWAMILWITYLIYFVCRVSDIWNETYRYGIVKGYRIIFLGHNGRVLRLYHVLRMIIDIPPAILGLFFPLLRKIFSLKIYEFKDKKDGDK